MIFFIVGMLLFLVFTIWGRVVTEKGMALLSAEQKSVKAEAMAKDRKISIIFLAAIIVAFLAATRFVHVEPLQATYAYFAAIFLYFFVSNWLAARRLKSVGMPEEFLKKNRLAGILRFVGIIVLIVSLAWFLNENTDSLQRLF